VYFVIAKEGREVHGVVERNAIVAVGTRSGKTLLHDGSAGAYLAIRTLGSILTLREPFTKLGHYSFFARRDLMPEEGKTILQEKRGTLGSAPLFLSTRFRLRCCALEP
jgi:hypothetical protein